MPGLPLLVRFLNSPMLKLIGQFAIFCSFYSSYLLIIRFFIVWKGSAEIIWLGPIVIPCQFPMGPIYLHRQGCTLGWPASLFLQKKCRSRFRPDVGLPYWFPVTMVLLAHCQYPQAEEVVVTKILTPWQVLASGLCDGAVGTSILTTWTLIQNFGYMVLILSLGSHKQIGLAVQH